MPSSYSGGGGGGVGGGSTVNQAIIENIAAVEGQGQYTLNGVPSTPSEVVVEVENEATLIYGDAYTISSNVLTLSAEVVAGLVTGSTIRVIYYVTDISGVNEDIESLTNAVATDVTDFSDWHFLVRNAEDSPAVSRDMVGTELAKALDVVLKKDTVAEMLALTGVPDGTRVDTARYSTSHTVGDGSGGEYVYDADSTATIDGGFVLPGVGGSLSFSGTTFNGTAGTGRWLLKVGDSIAAEQFGCDPLGATVSTDSFQRWVNSFRTSARQVRGIATGVYLVDDTITFDDLVGVEIQIGQAGYDQFVSTPQSGLLYDGTAGTGSEPQNCKPAVHFKNVNYCRFPVLNVQQKSDSRERYTTGWLWSDGSSSQIGNTQFGEVRIVGFERGCVFGLATTTGGLIGNTGSYTDDVFEANVFDRLEITLCRLPLYFDAKTSDNSVIKQLNLGLYLNVTGYPNWGPCPTIAKVVNIGHLAVEHHAMIQITPGQSSVDATIDTGTDVLTVSGSAPANGTGVLIRNDTNTYPGGLDGRVWWVVNSSGSTFQVSSSVGGSPQDITSAGTGTTRVSILDGTEYAWDVAGGNVTLRGGTYECIGFGMLRDTASAQNRLGWVMENCHGSDYVHTSGKLAVLTTRKGFARSCSFAGNVSYNRDIDVVGCNFIGDTSLRVVKATTTATDGLVLGRQDVADGNSAATASEIRSVVPNPILTRPGVLSGLANVTKIAVPGYSKNAGTVSAASDTIGIVGHTFANGDAVVITTSGTLPGGLAANTRYYVVGSVTDEFSLSATSGGSAINITSAGTGTHTISKAADICTFQLADGGGYSLGFDCSVFAKRNVSSTWYTALSKFSALAARETDNVLTAGIVEQSTNVVLTSYPAGVTPDFVYALTQGASSGGSRSVTLSIGMPNTDAFESMALVKIENLFLLSGSSFASVKGTHNLEVTTEGFTGF